MQYNPLRDDDRPEDTLGPFVVAVRVFSNEPEFMDYYLSLKPKCVEGIGSRSVNADLKLH